MTVPSFLCLLSLVGYVFAQQPTSDSTAKQQELQPDRSAFTFTNCDLDLRITPAKALLEARGAVTLRNDALVPQASAALQISSSLKWGSFRSGDQILASASRQIDSDVDHTGAVNEAAVRFVQPLPPGQSLEINFTYAGTVSKSANRLERLGAPHNVAMHSDWDQISSRFTGLRGIGYVLWYPVVLEPALLGEGNKAFHEMEKWKARHSDSALHVTLLFTGAEAAILSNGVQNTLSSSAPINIRWEPLDYTVPVITAGAHTCANCPGIFQIWSTPSTREIAKNWDQELKALRPGISGTQKNRELLIELPDPQDLTFESGDAFLSPIKDIPKPALDLLLVHGLLHSTMYSRRLWIYEGVAHLAQALMIEQQAGRRAAIEYLGQQRAALALAEPDVDSGSRFSGQSLIEASDEIYYRSKALYVWWMLRDMIGQEALEKALSAYRVDQDKQPSYMQRLLENASEKDLQWFFDDWVYGDRGLPEFRIDSVYPHKSLSGSYLVTVSVENLGAAAAEVPVFVRTKSGSENSLRLLVKGHDKVSTRIVAPDMPIEARVNDGSVPETDPGNNKTAIGNPQQ